MMNISFAFATATPALIAMAHGPRLRVIAEGVESEAQALYLRERDCDELQGYLFDVQLRQTCVASVYAREALLSSPMPTSREILCATERGGLDRTRVPGMLRSAHWRPFRSPRC